MWRKTPAGDEAAVACPADASGTITANASFVLFCFFLLSQDLSCSVFPLCH